MIRKKDMEYLNGKIKLNILGLMEENIGDRSCIGVTHIRFGRAACCSRKAVAKLQRRES